MARYGELGSSVSQEEFGGLRAILKKAIRREISLVDKIKDNFKRLYKYVKVN